MIVGYHVPFLAYGFWLPNDPRGSWSEFVGNWDLFRAAGKATRTTETHSLARQPHDRSLRLAAKKILDRPPIVFDGEQRSRSAGPSEDTLPGRDWRSGRVR